MTALGPELRRPVRQLPEPKIAGYWRVAVLVDMAYPQYSKPFAYRNEAEKHARFLRKNVIGIVAEVIFEPIN